MVSTTRRSAGTRGDGPSRDSDGAWQQPSEPRQHVATHNAEG